MRWNHSASTSPCAALISTDEFISTAPIAESEKAINLAESAQAEANVQISNMVPAHVTPRWKTATVSWFGVFPSVVIWSKLIGPWLRDYPPIVTTAIVTMIVVTTLHWIIMPRLQRLFAPWLKAQGSISKRADRQPA